MSTVSISSDRTTTGTNATGAGVCRSPALCAARGLPRDPGSADGEEVRNLVCTCKSWISLEAGFQ